MKEKGGQFLYKYYQQREESTKKMKLVPHCK